MNFFEDYATKRAGALFDLKGRTMLVAGGSTGIGLGMAAALGLAGAHVVIVGRSQEKLAKARAWLEDQGISVSSFSKSIAAEDFLEELDRFADGEGLCFHGVILSAALSHLEPFLTYDPAMLEEIIEVNLKAPFRVAQWAGNRMKKEGGSLLFISSAAALRGMPHNAAYSATKGALRSLTRTLALELAPHQIRVNTLIPGWVDTPMTAFAKAGDPDRPGKPTLYQKMEKMIPLRRWGLPKDFAGIGLWLMSEASAYVTGQEFVVDGGLLAR